MAGKLVISRQQEFGMQCENEMGGEVFQASGRETAAGATIWLLFLTRWSVSGPNRVVHLEQCLILSFDRR